MQKEFCFFKVTFFNILKAALIFYNDPPQKAASNVCLYKKYMYFPFSSTSEHQSERRLRRGNVIFFFSGSLKCLHILYMYLYYNESFSGVTAVREVFEETGVRSEFRSLLSIRQQHNHPGAFGMSDMYIVCRLSPLTYDINFCTQECLRCEWLDLAGLAETSDTTPITSRVARLLLHGLERGFHEIDLTMEELPAVYSGMFYQLYHRQLPPTPKS